MLTSFYQQFADIFGHNPEIVARAPGRIEFIGNHVDYNGGDVLGVAVDRETLVGVAATGSSTIRLRSTARPLSVTADVNALSPLKGDHAWANYPLGIVNVLKQAELPNIQGLDVLIDSSIPEGAGLSSSAALNLATAIALTAALGQALPREKLVRICQRSDHEFAGVPSGILDQGVSAFGKRGHLVHIDCRRPCFRVVPLPPGIAFWLFNTHTKHTLVHSLYSQRHAECMAALEYLQPFAPESAFLTDIPPETVEAHRSDLPETLYRRALHVTTEQQRVRQTIDALQSGTLSAVGALLFASHESSRTHFENSMPELDALVDWLREEPGVIGARLTGGGFGGAVMALTHHTFSDQSARRIAAQYEQQFEESPDVLRCRSADGAAVVPSPMTARPT